MSEIIPPHRLSLRPWFPLVVSLILAARRALLGPRSGFLAPLVQQGVAGGVDVFDFHLVVVHAHGGQSAGHLLLWQGDRRVSGGVHRTGERHTHNTVTTPSPGELVLPQTDPTQMLPLCFCLHQMIEIETRL